MGLKSSLFGLLLLGLTLGLDAKSSGVFKLSADDDSQLWEHPFYAIAKWADKRKLALPPFEEPYRAPTKSGLEGLDFSSGGFIEVDKKVFANANNHYFPANNEHLIVVEPEW